MKKALPWLFATFILTVLISFISSQNSSVLAETDHVDIYQIQIAGAGTGHSTNEFIELANPTNSAVDLSNWKLTRKTKGGTEGDLVATMSGTVPANGFFLITSDTYPGPTTGDLTYDDGSPTVSTNSTVLLYGSDGTTVIDKVGMGTASDFEGTATVNPGDGKSIERISPSTDTDNNSSDFAVQNTPDPMNSTGGTSTPTPTASPTPTSTPTATPTATSTPTSTPTTTPTPTMTPTSTPTTTPTVSPIETPTMSPTPTNFPFPFHPLVFTCRVNYITINTGWFILSVPQIFCGFNL
ncbi:MAG TPA: lamin tail domain-containing protein [Patescibacteria group bacterium]|nr:lamin tail domain-containing protein [Patescibacteria group bacterium]